MKEQELFDYLKGTHFPDLEKSEGVYDSFDCCHGPIDRGLGG